MMKSSSFLVLLLLVLLSLSLAGSVYAATLTESPPKTKDFHSRYFGISLHYPWEGKFTQEESLEKNREFGEYKKFRVMYTDNTTGLHFRIIGVRVDIDPKLLPENFNGSEGCGGIGTDDRDNLTILEFHSPDSIGGVKTSRSIVRLHESGNDTIETTYEICKTYTSGRSVEYWIFWSAPSDKFFTVKPVVQDIVDSIQLSEPVGLYDMRITPEQFNLDFPNSKDLFERFNSSEWGISFRYPNGLRVSESISDNNDIPSLTKGLITVPQLRDEISIEIEMWRYDIDPYSPVHSYYSEGLMCGDECPECPLEMQGNSIISGERARNATVYLEKNGREFTNEVWLICPVYKTGHVSGYEIACSAPSDIWQQVQPFFNDFISAIIIFEPS